MYTSAKLFQQPDCYINHITPIQNTQKWSKLQMHHKADCIVFILYTPTHTPTHPPTLTATLELLVLVTDQTPVDLNV